MEIDEKFMQRALQLAELGRAKVSPNPMVGAVLVHEGEIIGEGYHQQYGGKHAEVNAVEKVKDRSLLTNATMYVTLEPCVHHGHTPPCAEMIIDQKVPRVVIASRDVDQRVNGKGISLLERAGVQVISGIKEAEGDRLNRRFFTFHQKKRPYIILKWAQTADGFMARKDNTSKWISANHSRVLVHKWRSEEDAIMVGKQTVMMDDPQLTTRDWKGDHPVRVTFDRDLSLETDRFRIFDSKSKTIIFNHRKDHVARSNEWVRVRDDSLEPVLYELFQRNILSLIVEGGHILLSEFIECGLWDEARVFVSRSKFGKGLKAPHLDRNPTLTLNVSTDKLHFYENYSGKS